MATRRSRIKGIANLPQRRKIENKPAQNESALTVAESIDDGNESLNKHVKPVCTELVIPSNVPKIESNVGGDQKFTELGVEQIKESKTLNDVTNAPLINNQHLEVPRRRTFIKPSINPRLLSQKPKIKQDISLESNCTISPVVAPKEETVTSRPDKEETAICLQTEDVKLNLDNEYPSGPLSPTKIINRSRIKAVPRLGQRRSSVTIHGSASESEDDGRKNYKRIRTESSCSAISSSENVARADPIIQQKKEFSSIIQRKCKRTEQSRKMAEARRQFYHKFGNQAPDKQKLTMIDLIFYNPITKPMSQRPRKVQIKEITDEAINEKDSTTIENADDELAPVPSADEEEEDDGMPAPQIKIGANGEIIVDEKSLVIENAQTKKGREELQKSEIVDGDFDTGYGVYKREKRSKDWTKEETLRFYKALNTIGTDFTMMVELFYGRSRRELKMKFKKEERVNRVLIDKALTQPVQFDITELRKEAEKQRKLELLRTEKQLEKFDSSNKRIPYHGLNKNKKDKRQTKKEVKEARKKPTDIYTKLEKGIKCIWESDSSDQDEDNPDDILLTPFIKPRATRSGRVPKPRKPYQHSGIITAPIEKELQEIPVVEEESSTDTVRQIGPLQPGSIMIFTSQTPTGEPTFKVFMVTPNQNRVPINLTQDMLNNLTQNGGENVNPATENNGIISEEYTKTIPAEECNLTIVEENNPTIPAEEPALEDATIYSLEDYGKIPDPNNEPIVPIKENMCDIINSLDCNEKVPVADNLTISVEKPAIPIKENVCDIINSLDYIVNVPDDKAATPMKENVCEKINYLDYDGKIPIDLVTMNDWNIREC